jgi:hypothetical protein
LRLENVLLSDGLLFLKLFHEFICYFTLNIVVKPTIWPNIQYPALTAYPAEYPVSGLWISRISGRADIWLKQYLVHPYFK